jgi:hypothetical protein
MDIGIELDINIDDFERCLDVDNYIRSMDEYEEREMLEYEYDDDERPYSKLDADWKKLVLDFRKKLR